MRACTPGVLSVDGVGVNVPLMVVVQQHRAAARCIPGQQ